MAVGICFAGAFLLSVGFTYAQAQSFTTPVITAVPTLTTTASSFGGGELGVIQDEFSGISNATIRTFCISSVFSEFQAFTPTIVTTETDTITEGTGSGTATSFFTTTFTPGFNPVISPPCCSTCTIQANNVELLFFPPAPTTGPSSSDVGSTTTNSKGFTFTSGSVYLAFDSISAFDLCSTATTLTSVTVALPLTDLSSIGGSGNMTHPVQVNLNDLTDCPTTSSTFSTGSFDFKCTPQLVVPPEVRTLNSAFASCALELHGVVDPPTFLTPVPALDQTSAPATTSSSTTLPPPQSETQPPTASSTPPPPPITTSSTPPPPPPSTSSSPPPPPSSTSPSPPAQSSSAPDDTGNISSPDGSTPSQTPNQPQEPASSTAASGSQPSNPANSGGQALPASGANTGSSQAASGQGPSGSETGANAGGGASPAGANSVAGTSSPAGGNNLAAVPTAVVPIVSVITSGSSTFTSTIGSSTIARILPVVPPSSAGANGAIGAAGTEAASSSAISTVPILSTVTSGSSVSTETLGSSTIFAAVSSGTGGGSGSGSGPGSAGNASSGSGPASTFAVTNEGVMKTNFDMRVWIVMTFIALAMNMI